MISGYPSRALREDEFHRKVREMGCAFSCDVSWVTTPIVEECNDCNGDDDESDREHRVSVISWPVLFPSSVATWYGVQP